MRLPLIVVDIISNKGIGILTVTLGGFCHTLPCGRTQFSQLPRTSFLKPHFLNCVLASCHFQKTDLWHMAEIIFKLP